MGMTLESGHYRSTVDLQKQEALNKSILFQLELMVRILPDKSVEGLFLENIIPRKHNFRPMCTSCNTLVETHSSKKKANPFLSLFLVFGGVATLPHLQIVKKYFDECVSTNVLQLGHINRIR